jgi:tetratricopeptide (TPR) repeat protein
MFGISLLFLIASVLNILFYGFSAHNIFFIAISVVFILYTAVFAKGRTGPIYRAAIPGAMILLFIITGLIFNPFAAEKAYASKYNKAMVYISNADYEKAAALLDELDKEKANDEQVALAQGILYLRMANYSNSWNYLSKAYGLDPYDINIAFNMGLNQYHNGSLQYARDIFESITDTAPKILKAHVYAGTICMELNDYKRAIYHLENARFLEPDAVPIYIYLAECRIASMDYTAAKADLDAALSKSPSAEQKDRLDLLAAEVAPYVGGDAQ